MWFSTSPILRILDDCAKDFTFPVLDNGYVYLAATRLSVYAAKPEWALVIEVFGFSPRAGLPDISIYTFASQLHNRDNPERYVSREAYEKYLKRNPHNEFRSAYPMDEGDWQDPDDLEFLAQSARHVAVRGDLVPLPSVDEYKRFGITLEDPSHVRVFEICRFLTATLRPQMLGTIDERRVSVLPHLREIMVLDEWNHPDVTDGVRPSKSDTFRQLARVLETEDPRMYRPTEPPNTHWSNWPEGGLL
ncbi:MAG TPA: hypothetical protein VNA69_01585 [Thermoanaerobaculia bacterium]|nr:hypothetical protein [Thermoanaerobaculia bacterium]